MSLFVATPAANSRCFHREYMFGLVDAVAKLGAVPCIQEGNSITQNRDTLTALFLASGHSHMLMVDTDIGWRAHHAQQLLDAGKDVVSGAYCYKDESERIVGDLTKERSGALVRATKLPAGFLLVSRAAVLKVAASMAEQLYHVDGVGVVTAMWQDILQWGPGATCYREDAAFSKRCLDTGLRLWMHLGVALTHYGEAPFGPPKAKPTGSQLAAVPGVARRAVKLPCV